MFVQLPENIRREEERLIAIMFESDEELTIEEFIEKYGSETYKNYVRKKEERDAALWEHGIIEN